METYSAAAACENATVISSIQLSPLLSFLIAVQTAALASLGGGPNFDPKFYVDLPLKYQLNVTTKAFQTLSSSSSQNTTIPPSMAIAIHHHPFSWGGFFFLEDHVLLQLSGSVDLADRRAGCLFL
jgi:hypothetical protein